MSESQETTPPDSEHDDLEPGPPDKPRFVLGFVVGLIACVVLALVWAAVAGLSGFEIGYLAFAVGGITGFAVVRGAGSANHGTGALAVGLSIFGLILAKVLTVVLFLPSQVAAELAKDPETVGNRIYQLEYRKGNIDPEIMQWYDNNAEDVEPPAELAKKIRSMDADYVQRAAMMSSEERERMVEPFADALVESIPFEERFDLSFYDLLWLGLAVGAAWRTGLGHED
ncbi:MAG: hypothetical protein R3E66_06545 [bacterium]